MTEQTKLEKLAEAMDMDVGKLAPDMALESISKWDSLASINFILLLEDEFDKQIGAGELKGCKTVADLMDLMAED